MASADVCQLTLWCKMVRYSSGVAVLFSANVPKSHDHAKRAERPLQIYLSRPAASVSYLLPLTQTCNKFAFNCRDSALLVNSFALTVHLFCVIAAIYL